MSTQQVLADQLRQTHQFIGMTLAEVTPEQLHWLHPGATIQSIAAIVAHLAYAEDWEMNTFVSQRDLLFDRDGWGERAGIPPTTSVEEMQAAIGGVELGQVFAYAQAVYAESEAAIEKLPDAEMERIVTFGPLGDLPLKTFIANVVNWHHHQHAGEISALVGLQGGKGLFF